MCRSLRKRQPRGRTVPCHVWLPKGVPKIIHTEKIPTGSIWANGSIIGSLWVSGLSVVLHLVPKIGQLLEDIPLDLQRFRDRSHLQSHELVVTKCYKFITCKACPDFFAQLGTYDQLINFFVTSPLNRTKSLLIGGPKSQSFSGYQKKTRLPCWSNRVWWRQNHPRPQQSAM